MKELDPATAIPGDPIKSHAGAVKYWTEAASKK